MSRGIPVSPRHGVNPTIPICFWCGKEKSEIALVGKLKGDVEAPKNMIVNYDPCDECAANFAQGVTAMEVTTSPNMPNQPPIQKGAYPTGRLFVLATRAADRIFPNNAPWNDDMKVLIEKSVFEDMFKEALSPDPSK